MSRLVDIKPALMLAQRFLDNYVIPATLSYQTMNELETNTYDFFLSNYAFTELPRIVQDIYLERIILGSPKGYITYNEGTPPEFESYRRDELLRLIPGSKIREEKPLTSPTNCIIYWDASKSPL